MLKNFSESLKNTIQLITSLVQLGILLAVIGGGYWVYTKVSNIPSAIGGIVPPKIEIKVPEINLGLDKTMQQIGKSIGSLIEDEPLPPFRGYAPLPPDPVPTPILLEEIYRRQKEIGGRPLTKADNDEIYRRAKARL